MQAGALRHRITIQKKGGGTNSWGEPDPDSWTDVVTVWANIRHQSGAESIKSDKPTSEVRASIRIRWRTGIDAGMRVVHGSNKYDIRAVLPDEVSRVHVDLVCELVS
jgi:SPP1 family predicted phage head-tail adaptor